MVESKCNLHGEIRDAQLGQKTVVKDRNICAWWYGKNQEKLVKECPTIYKTWKLTLRYWYLNY
jgi:hypothetical protein